MDTRISPFGEHPDGGKISKLEVDKPIPEHIIPIRPEAQKILDEIPQEHRVAFILDSDDPNLEVERNILSAKLADTRNEIMRFSTRVEELELEDARQAVAILSLFLIVLLQKADNNQIQIPLNDEGLREYNILFNTSAIVPGKTTTLLLEKIVDGNKQILVDDKFKPFISSFSGFRGVKLSKYRTK